MKKLLNSKTLVWFVFTTFLASTLFIIARLIFAPFSPELPGQDIRVKSDYALMLLQCFLGMIIMLLPGILQRRLKLVIPSGMVIAFAIFLYCAIYLGEVHYFYYRIPYWDTLLHTFSGFALGAVGFSILGLLNKSESAPISLSPAFVSIFTFCFAVSLGALWEIYEFTVDCAAGLNMQKFMLENGDTLVGQAALADTMKDIIVDTLGALAISIIGYISMKYKTGWLERFQLKIDSPEPVPVPVPVPVYAFQMQAVLQPALQAAIQTNIQPSMQSSLQKSLRSSLQTSMQASMPSSIQVSAPASLQASMPSSMHVSAPASLQASMPSSLQVSAPASLQVSAPTSLQAFMPSSLQVSAPVSLQASMPSSMHVSAPT